jgi:hypothetical protein
LERLQLSSTHSGYVIRNNPRSTRISSKGGNPLSLHPAKRDPTRKFRTSETHATNETMASSQHEKEKMNNDQTRNQEIRDDLHVTANVLLLPTPTKRRFHQSAISLLYKCIPALANSLATPISITNPCMVCGRSMCVTKKR